MRKKIIRTIDMSFEDRKAMATHYIDLSIQPSSVVLLCFMKEGSLYSCYINVHKQEAKRMKLIHSTQKYYID